MFASGTADSSHQADPAGENYKPNYWMERKNEKLDGGNNWKRVKH